MLLNIFHTGGVFEALTLIWLGLTIWFGYQAYKAHNSGWYQIDQKTGERTEGDEKIPYSKIPMFWYTVVITVIYLITVFAFLVPEYKGV